MIEIVKLDPSEWPAYRRLRLEALQTDPVAFGSTYAETAARPDEHFRLRLEEAAQGERGWLLFARQDGTLVGMMGAYLFDQPHRIATIISVYVSPAARRQGIARRLMDALLAELHAQGIPTAQLEVVTTQTPAVKFYQSCGFKIISQASHLMGSGDFEDEYLMEKDLNGEEGK